METCVLNLCSRWFNYRLKAFRESWILCFVIITGVYFSAVIKRLLQFWRQHKTRIFNVERKSPRGNCIEIEFKYKRLNLETKQKCQKIYNYQDSGKERRNSRAIPEFGTLDNKYNLRLPEHRPCEIYLPYMSFIRLNRD